MNGNILPGGHVKDSDIKIEEAEEGFLNPFFNI